MNQSIFKCHECGKMVKEDKLCIIDSKKICLTCIYGNTKPFEIYPIGIVKNNLQRNRSNFETTGPEEISRIELIPSQERFLYKLSDEKYLTVIYYLHKAGPVKSVFNRGLDGKKVGVFASCTPDRLSRLAIQDVKLVRIEGTILYVERLDAIDGSPVLDIKLCRNAYGKNN